ncbi:MAG TPA: glycosyltransferase [candidate division Zixibacteria bacterium]|nr:glycosyltransferase [candidate division Zixibacteria bacterium]
MTRPREGAQLPPEVAALLEERARARAARDFERADVLRDRLHDLGWEPVDHPGGRSTARPRPTGRGRGEGYLPGAAASLLEEPATLPASVVAMVDDHPEDLARFADGLRRHPPALGWELLVVANAPSGELPALDPLPAQVLPTAERVGWADAANLGMRRARGAVIVLVDTSIEPVGDWLTPLVAAFDDPGVGMAGPWGVTSADARQFQAAPPGEVDAVEAYCLAVRREALRAVGGFDHRFRFYRNADLDLSFAIRDAGWRAIRTGPLPLAQHEHRGWTAHDAAERDRLSRRNFYRFLKRWGKRPDLLLHPGSDR